MTLLDTKIEEPIAARDREANLMEEAQRQANDANERYDKHSIRHYEMNRDVRRLQIAKQVLEKGAVTE